ncbi:MAG: acetylornithine/succinylornithine family transaminase [Eggerthellaceae bacterium]|nr:acetylornithine/succinylornithine family transaminase [Eggerthellaceae bacterium]
MSLEQQQQLEATYVMSTFGRKPVELVRGKGMYVYDDEGRAYLDFLAGIGVVSLGHCHPWLVEAIAAQAAKLIHVGNYYYIENRGEVAEHVSRLLEEPDVNGQAPEPGHWKSFFANSGAEANECAIKLARLYAKRAGRQAQNIVTLERSFHGRTLATLAATAQPAKQEAFQPLPAGFIHTPINDIAALEALFEREADSICAVMVECVQGESGVHPCTQEFLAAAERLAHGCGALLICDEVQSGMYRCGKRPFAFQRLCVQPDIVTIAKGVASGFPMGICAARAQIADTFEPGDHGTTFGGSSLAVAAAKATLELMDHQPFIDNIEETGAYLREQLAQLPHVIEVRGLGLMCACDLEEGFSAPDVVAQGQEGGALFNATGPATLRFLPPLVCEKQHVDELIALLSRLLA